MKAKTQDACRFSYRASSDVATWNVLVKTPGFCNQMQRIFYIYRFAAKHDATPGYRSIGHISDRLITVAQL